MARASSKVAELREILRAAGLRATSARLAVLEVLLDARAPISHGDVCDRVGERAIDRATLYRNLIDLAEVGLVRRSDHGDHVWRFEWTGGENTAHAVEHAHFLCSRCGAVTCLPDGAIAIHAVRGAPRSLRAGVEVQVRGVCDTCG